MISLKGTSDDESTPAGICVLGREERSQDGETVVRLIDKLIVQDLLSNEKRCAATDCSKRGVPPFGKRNPSRFPEVPKKMPLQYFDTLWFNNPPPQARARLEPELIVAIGPNSGDFFSRRSENKLSIAELTEKYGDEVFAAYDLDYGHPAKEASGPNDSDDSGESVGTHESDSDAGSDDAASMASFLSDDEVGSGDQHGLDDDDSRKAEFAATYGIPMDDLDMDVQAEIFGTDSEDDV